MAIKDKKDATFAIVCDFSLQSSPACGRVDVDARARELRGNIVN